MKTTAWLSLPLLCALSMGCGGNPDCDRFAAHVADIMAKEHASEMTAEIRDKMIKTTTEACNASPPEPAALQCGIAAPSSEAIKACETSAP